MSSFNQQGESVCLVNKWEKGSNRTQQNKGWEAVSRGKPLVNSCDPCIPLQPKTSFMQAIVPSRYHTCRLVWFYWTCPKDIEI